MQLWAKPQPAGAVAVLILNNGAPGSANTTATFTLDEIRFEGTAGGSVLDIWADKTMPLAANARSFTSDAFGPHDSRFYLIKPSSSPATSAS